MTPGVGEVLAWLWGLAPAVGHTRLVGVDGFSGAGKSSVARRLAEADGDVDVVELEAFYLGWSGLEAGVRRARETLVEPMRRGEAPTVRPWDWVAGCEGEPVTLELGGLVLLEGCGAGARVLRPYESALIWVHAGAEERERRLRAREDWPVYRPYRELFREQEERLAARDATADAADRVLCAAEHGPHSVASGT